MQTRISSMPINIENTRPRSALLRGVHITEFKGHIINPDPIILQETDLLLEEFLSPTKLKALTGVNDLSSVENLEMIVDTSETSLGNFGIYLPNLKQLKLNGSHVPRIRDLGTSLMHLSVLWLSRSGLMDLDGIPTLNSLKELYLAYNEISDISSCSLLENLTSLDLEGNLIEDLKQIEFLNLCPQLKNLTLYGNPISSKASPESNENDLDYSYKHEVIRILPSLQTLDDEFTLNIKPKSPTKMLKLGNKSLNSEQCPFDDDWQLINQILDEGIGPSEEKLAINESMRPGSGSSASGGCRTATGVRPLSAMRPLSSYRLKTSSSEMRPNSRRLISTSTSLNSTTSSSRFSTSPPSTSNNTRPSSDPVCDTQNDASHLTVGPTFQGNPFKSLLARKKINNSNNSNNSNQSNTFTIQMNPDLLVTQGHTMSRHKNSNESKFSKNDQDINFKELIIENKVLHDEIQNWKRDHAMKLEERKSYFEPQVLRIEDDDPLPPEQNTDDEDDHLLVTQRPKSAFKSSFDCDEAVNVVVTPSDDGKQHHRKKRSKSRSKKSKDNDQTRQNLMESTSMIANNHQPIIVSSSFMNNAQPTVIRPLNQPPLNGLSSLRQLKTNLAPLPGIRLPK